MTGDAHDDGNVAVRSAGGHARAAEGSRARLAGWPALRATVELPEERTIELWTVERLEDHIDARALLDSAKVPEPPYWALVWIGARAVASRMLEETPTPEQRVLDLGCGLGLAGVAAGGLGARVVFADYAPECLPFAQANAHDAGMTDYEVLALDFTRDTLAERFDVILAADIVYDPAHYEPLARFLDLHLAEGGVIWLTESLRADARRFLAGMAEAGYEDECVACWVMEDGRRERTWLHRLTRRS